MRVFGFSAAQQKIMSDFKRNKQTIHLDDCQVTQARIGCKMEVMLKGSTKISDHPQKFLYPAWSLKIILLQLSVFGTLSPRMLEFERVTVDVKVQTITDLICVTGGKKKQ